MSLRSRTGPALPVVALGAIFAVAAALRLWHLGEVPFGLHPDETHNGLDALRIAAGDRPVFLPGNNGREPLFMYLMALTMAWAGPTAFGLRLAAVLAGLASIAATAWAARVLPWERPGRVAVTAAAWQAFTFWPIAQSRYGLRAVLLPVFVALVVGTWWRALTAGTPRQAVGWGGLAGAAVAGAIYTHMTGRALPLVLLLTGILAITRSGTPNTGRRLPAAALGAAAAVSLALALPQVLWFQAHPEMLAYRADQVSLLNPEARRGDLAGALATSAQRLVAAPLARGDTSWYHNVSGRPIFDPIAGLFFVVGVWRLAALAVGSGGPIQARAALLLAATAAVATAPTWLSVGAPNYVRFTGIWPVLFVLPALGLDYLLERAAALGPRLKPALPAAAVLAVAVSGGLAVRDYFSVYAEADQVYTAFNGAALERAHTVAAAARDSDLYVSPTLWNQSVVRFVSHSHPPAAAPDHVAGLVLPPDGPGVYAFDSAEAAAAHDFGRRWPDMRRRDILDSRGQLSLVIFTLDRTLWPRGASPKGIDFAGHVRLQSATVPRVAAAGDELSISLEWLALRPTQLDHNIFIHLNYADAASAGQWDGPPLAGTYGLHQWRPGERIFETHTLSVSPDAPAGEVTVTVGWYDWRDGNRLRGPDVPDGALPLANLPVQAAP